MHISQLGDIVEDAQTVSDQKFSELEKKFEVIMSSMCISHLIKANMLFSSILYGYLPFSGMCCQ